MTDPSKNIFNAGQVKRLTKSIIVILLFISISGVVHGQTVYTKGADGIKSPSVASITKANEADVSLYTGGVSFNIPLYEVGGYPIGIGYSYNGFRPADIPSSVGLGWTLNGIGVITRTVRSMPDEWANGYRNISTLLQSQQNNETTTTFTNQLQEFLKDGLPDIFSFSFGGYSGKFYWDKFGKIRVEDDMPFDIVPTISNGSIIKIEVTDYTGVIYTFGLNGAIEEFETKTTPYYNGQFLSTSTRIYDSSWFISKIVYPSGNEINFSYNIDSSIPSSYTERRSGADKYWSVMTGSHTSSTKVEDRIRNKVTLNEISFKDQSVKFVHSNRLDYAQESKLDSVIVKTNGNTKIGYAFEYDYINTDQRLILKRVKQLDLNKVSLNEWSFEYNGITNQVPEIDTYQTDHWGYYNGEVGNESVPDKLSSYIAEIPAGSQNYQVEEGMIRDPDPVNSKIGILERIVYPTGGSVEYLYEPNTYAQVSGETNLKQIIEFDACGGQQCNTAGASGTSVYSDAFDLDLDSGNRLQFNVSALGFDIFGEPAPNPPYQDICSSGSVYNNKYLVAKIVGVSDPTYSENLAFNPYGSECTTPNSSLAPPDGTYKIRLDVPSGFSDLVQFSVKALVEKEPKHIIGPGHRIKYIIYSDGLTQTFSKKLEYKYEQIGDTTASSGVLVRPIVYFDTHVLNGGPLYTRYSDSQEGSSDRGPSLGYSNVTVKNITGLQSGYTQYQFSNATSGVNNLTNTFNDETNGPFHLGMGWTGKGWGRGKLILKKVFTSNDELLREEQYHYSHNLRERDASSPSNYELYNRYLQNIFDIPEYHTRQFNTSSESWIGSGNDTFISIVYRQPIWSRLDSVVTKNYDSNYSMETSTSYVYDNFNKQIQTQSEVNSNQEKRVTLTNYAYDQSEYSGMKDLNMLSPPYSITIKDGTGTVLQKRWTLWDTYNTNWLPCGTWLWDGTMNGGEPKAPTSCSSN